MPFGYGYLEFWNIKNKAIFLKNHANDFEKNIGLILWVFSRGIIFFLITAIFIYPIEKIYFGFGALFLQGIINQNYRRYLLLKYDYNKKESKLKTFFLDFILILGFVLSIFFLLGFSVFDFFRSELFY